MRWKQQHLPSIISICPSTAHLNLKLAASALEVIKALKVLMDGDIVRSAASIELSPFSYKHRKSSEPNLEYRSIIWTHSWGQLDNASNQISKLDRYFPNIIIHLNAVALKSWWKGHLAISSLMFVCRTTSWSKFHSSCITNTPKGHNQDNWSITLTYFFLNSTHGPKFNVVLKIKNVGLSWRNCSQDDQFARNVFFRKMTLTWY